MNTLLEARDVRKHYRLGKNNTVEALRGASVSIASGEMVAIMGPSGSGKSTLMHILGCLDAPDSGAVSVMGRRVECLSERELTGIRSREIGFIFQGFNLVSTLTAQENVALAAEYAGMSRKLAMRNAQRMLVKVGLGDRLRHYPNELSGGQQQRVAIARALVNHPAVILGDEPTGDLDTKTSAETIEMMREINQTTGTTFVLVTHNPEVGEACDRVISVRDGRIIDDTGSDKIEEEWAELDVEPEAPVEAKA